MMEKNLAYYQKLPYTTVISIEEDNDDDGYSYVARLLEMPHCIGVGKSPEEAVRELELNKRMKLETHLEMDFPIPEPCKYSGQFHLRVGSSLHESLAHLAELENVSLNQYLTNILARAVGVEEGKSRKIKKVHIRK